MFKPLSEQSCCLGVLLEPLLCLGPWASWAGGAERDGIVCLARGEKHLDKRRKFLQEAT